MTKRIEFIDIAKFLCISLVVVGHSGIKGYVHDWIYVFHMPFFFFVSGFFLRPDNRHITEIIKKNIKQLIIPYTFFYLITIPFGLVYIHFHGVPVSLDYIWKPFVGMVLGLDRLIGEYSYFTNGPLWFLLALFWAKLFFYANRCHKYSLLGLLVSMGISYILFILLKSERLNVWSIAQAFLLYPYLCVGYILNNKFELSARIESAHPLTLWRGLFLTLLCVSIFVPYIGRVEYGSLLMGNYPYISFGVAIAGSIMILILSKVLSTISRCKPLFLSMGEGTIVVLAVHHPIMDIYKFIFIQIGLNVTGGSVPVCFAVSLMTLITCFPIVLLFEKYCKKLIGQ